MAIQGTKDVTAGAVIALQSGDKLLFARNGSVFCADAGILAAEITARSSADTTLQDNIDAEATTARAAEEANATAIATETTARTTADTTLQSNIDAEATTRSDADAALDARLTSAEGGIDTNAADIAAEVARAQAAEAANTSAISSEASARSSADTTLQNNIDAEATTARAAEEANATAIATETTARTTADTTLQSNIDAETARAQAIEAGKAALAGSSTQNFSMLDGTVAGNFSVAGQATLDPSFPSKSQSFTDSPSIGEAAILEDTVSDKLCFTPAANISVEYTEDGTTWTDCGLTDAQKNQLVLGRIVSASSSSGVIYNLPSSCRSVRFTFENSIYQSWLQWLYAWFSCASPLVVTVSSSDHDGTTWTSVSSETVAARLPGHLFVAHSRIRWGSTHTLFSKYVRVTFTPDWLESDTTGLGVWGFRWFGTYPASNRLLYTWDFAKNITFPSGIIPGTIVPRVANTYTCGTASSPWAGGYTQTAFTETSDAEKKQDIAVLSGQADLLAAGEAMLDNLCTYRLRDSVATKGDAARTHLGHTYQSVEQALVDAGVDAERIGILCGRDQAQETVQESDADGNPLTDEQGNPVTKTVPAVDADGNPVYVKGLRYGELYALLAAALAHRVQALDARVAALEARIG